MEKLPIYISGAFIAYVSYQALKNGYNRLLTIQKDEFEECSKEIESSLNTLSKALKNHHSDPKNESQKLQPETLSVLRKLERSLEKGLKNVRAINERYEEEGFQSACELYYNKQPPLDLISPDEFFSLDEELDVHEWKIIDDGLHTEKHKATWRILVDINNSNFYYCQCARYFALRSIPHRKIRTKQVGCINDIDYLIKLHALRGSFESAIEDELLVNWVINTIKDILLHFLILDNRSTAEFEQAYDELVKFSRSECNVAMLESEMAKKGITNFSFFDVIFDYCILESLDDMESPPAIIKSILSTRMIPYFMKTKSLEAAISKQMNLKKSEVDSNSFMYRFYTLTGTVSCTFACGLFCSSGVLNECCQMFVNNLQELSRDCFSTEKANYQSQETLSKDIITFLKARMNHIHNYLIKTVERQSSSPQ